MVVEGDRIVGGVYVRKGRIFILSDQFIPVGELSPERALLPPGPREQILEEITEALLEGKVYRKGDAALFTTQELEDPEYTFSMIEKDLAAGLPRGF